MRTRSIIMLVRLVAGGAATMLAACTVGPDYAKPATESPKAWTGGENPASDRPIASKPTSTVADVERWWTIFSDATLGTLIERANDGNLSLAQAEARVRQARAARQIVDSGSYPQVDAGLSASRSRAASSRGGTTSNSFRAGFDASWEIDLFGAVRRSVEAADADLLAAGFDREDIRVTVAAEVATTYFDLRGAQRQLAIARQNLAAQQQTLTLTQQRFDVGFVSRLDVANAKSNVTQTESQIPSFDAQIRASIYALSVLLGQEPGSLLAELSLEAPLPAIPTEIPVGLPSDLLLRRPDIRRAEADLHAATARIGVAVADQYPRISLTGSLGTQGDKITSLGTLADRFWSIGPSVSVPVFTAGRVEGNIEQSRAIAEQATIAYRQSVLTALQDVETSLASYTREQQRQAALADSAVANRDAVDLSLKLYNGGRTDFLNVLSAQRQLYATESQLTQSQINIANDLVALFKALGGGWNVQPATPEGQPDPAKPKPE